MKIKNRKTSLKLIKITYLFMHYYYANQPSAKVPGDKFDCVIVDYKKN